MIKKIILATIAVFVVIGGYARDISGETRTTARSLSKPAADNPIRTILNIGNWGYWQRDNGESAQTPSANSGGIYPRGTAGAIYLDGILVGGYQNGLLRVSGQSHFMGTEPGYIQDGQHMTKGLDPRVRLYRIRKDYATLTADQVRPGAQELNELAGLGDVTKSHTDAILAQYAKDWAEWPTELGAPYYDLNNNGVYEPALGETPGIANADQVIWYVITDADKGTTNSFYGTDPIGVEIQITLWAYNQPGASLGQLVFKQLRIINKGDGDLTEAYVTLFSDPDLGDYGNDLIGVDVDKSMMYCYNGEVTDSHFEAFGLAVPAAGYDFFAGPIVEAPGETAIFDLKEKEGYRNLPASSFGYYGDAENSDPQPQGEVESARKYYNLMKGFRPFDDLENPIAWLDQNGEPSKFIYNGDPVRGTGHLDSSPGDRRMLINSGPFTLAEGDTQDVVVAVVGGLGDNNLSSITAMRNNDVVAQQLFDDLFQSVPASPPPPVVEGIAMDDHVILDWGSVVENVYATEQSVIAGYEFQGYNIYQLPTAAASKDQATRIATYDKVDGVLTIYGKIFLPQYGEPVSVPVQFGLDAGVKRSIVIEKDHLTGRPFNLGSDYYFAVTAYNYNGAPALIEDQALETSITPILVTLSPPPLGTEYGAEAGDAIETAHPEGPSDGSVVATIVDPTQLTGDDYEVFFETEQYFLDFDGIWKNTTESAKANAKLLDVSPSVVTGVAVTGPMGTLDLNFEVDVQSPDYNYGAGVLITIPGAVIKSATAPGGIAVAIQADGQSVLFGDLDIDGSGDFAGGEHITINVLASSVDDESIAFDFVIYDDGWGDLVCDVDRDGVTDPDMVEYCNAYGLGPGNAVIANAEGSGTITEFGYAYKTIEGWYVRNLNTNQIVTPHSTQQGTFAADNIENGVFVPAHAAGTSSGPIADGIQVLVHGPELGIKAVSETDADDNILDANVGVYPPSLGTTGYILSHRDHAGLGGGRTHDRFDYWGMDDIIIDFSETSLCFSYSGATTITETVSGNQSMAPFSVYRKKFPSGEMMRLFTGWWDTDGDNVWSVNADWTDYGKPSYEPIYAWQGYDAGGNEIPYDPANDAAHIAEGGLPNDTGQSFGSNPGFYHYPFVTATMLVTYLDGSTPPWGNKIWLTTNKANTAADKFTFTAPANTVSDELAKDAVEMVNVFPNPYYAGNSQETNRFDNFVTFTHLPPKAKLRIFSLDGRIVRELDKDTDSQFFKWNLRNHTDLPVASGVYLVHIDMDIDGQDLGEKILKVFIVQPNQVVEYY